MFWIQKNSEGNLEPDDEQAEIVKKIYELYLSGISINGIISILAEENILSPQGSNKWSKKTISIILTNGKYTGSVQVLKSDPNRSSYCMLNAHEAIISGEDFARVQEEMYRRARKKPKYESTAIALIKNEDWIKQISQTKGEDTVD